MRILHVTDTHLGSRWALSGAPPDLRARDHERALELALIPAVREEVDLVVHSGDLFDRSCPDRPAIASARRLLAEAARRVPVLVMPGNHDRHGLAASISGLPGVRVVDEPERVVVGGLALGFAPFVRTADAFADAARRLGPVDLLVAHQAFDGHRVPGFRFRVGAQPDTIGEAHLPRYARWVLCGHLHPRQVVQVGGATVVCPGSTERTSFAELDQTKGYARWHVGADVRHQWVDLPARAVARVAIEEDLAAVEPGMVVRCTAGMEAAVRAKGAYCAVQRSQLPLFGSPARAVNR